MSNKSLSRRVLYHRHRLSHQQIGHLRGEQAHDSLLEEKVGQLALVREFLRISDALRKEGIWFVPVKGPMLSWRIYEDATTRRFKDLDILVGPDDMDHTLDLLGNLGYRPCSMHWPPPGELRDRIMAANNQYDMVDSSSGIQVEILWRLVSYPVIPFDRMNELTRENIIEIEYAGRQFNQLNTEFELLYLVVHGGLHAWIRLKWLVDVKEILERHTPDREKFARLVKELKAERMAGLCNLLLRDFFPGSRLPADYPVPRWFYSFALNKINHKKDLLHRTPSGFFALTRYRLMAFPGIKHRIRVLETVLYWIQEQNLPFNPVLLKIYRFARSVAGKIKRIF